MLKGPHLAIRSLFILVYAIAIASLAVGIIVWVLDPDGHGGSQFGPLFVGMGGTTFVINGLIDIRQTLVIRQFRIFALEAIGHSAEKLLDLCDNRLASLETLRKGNPQTVTRRQWMGDFHASFDRSWRHHEDLLNDYHLAVFQSVNYRFAHELKTLVDSERTRFNSLAPERRPTGSEKELANAELALRSYRSALSALLNEVKTSLKTRRGFAWAGSQYGPK